MITPRHVLQLITALGVALCLAGIGGLVYHDCIRSWAYWESYSTVPRDLTLDRMLADKLLFLGVVGLALLATRILLSLQWRRELRPAPGESPAEAPPLPSAARPGPYST